MKYRAVGRINRHNIQYKPSRFWKDLWGYQKKIVGRLDNLFDDVGDACVRYYDMFFTRYRPSFFPELNKYNINVKEAWGSIDAINWDCPLSGLTYRGNLRRYKDIQSFGLDDVTIENFYSYHNDSTLYSSSIYFKSMFMFNEIICFIIIGLLFFLIFKYVKKTIPKVFVSFFTWWLFFGFVLVLYMFDTEDLLSNLDYLFIVSYSFLEFGECYYQYIFKTLLLLSATWNEQERKSVYITEIINQQYHTLLDFVEARERIRRVEFRKESFSLYFFKKKVFKINFLKEIKKFGIRKGINQNYSTDWNQKSLNVGFLSANIVQKVDRKEYYDNYIDLLDNYHINKDFYKKGVEGLWLKLLKKFENYIVK